MSRGRWSPPSIPRITFEDLSQLLTDAFGLTATAVEPKVVEQYKNHVAALATKHLDVAKDAASTSGVACNLVRVEHDQPYKAIIDTAESGKCDVIVMASHGRRGVSAILLGSETIKVLTHSTFPVIVVRGQNSAAFFAAS